MTNEKLQEEYDKARAEVERLTTTADVVGALADVMEEERNAALAEVERLTEDRDKAWDRIDQLTHFLILAHDCIRDGFMDGEWATIVQTQKTLLPSGAVMESKNAEKVFNEVGKALGLVEEDA